MELIRVIGNGNLQLLLNLAIAGDNSDGTQGHQ